MFKKIMIIFILVFTVLLSSCTAERNEENYTQEQTNTQSQEEKIKGVWLSVFDMYFLKYSEDDFKMEVKKIFGEISSFGFNNIFVQVRPCCDAIYKSEIFPWSSYISGKQGVSNGFDPLEIMVNEAHKNNLKIHAWINPYRILSENDVSKLSENNPALPFINEKTSDVYIGETGIFFNPSSMKAQKIILDGVREIVKNYDVDGIHIDDYFYPTTEEGIDKKEYESYTNNKGVDNLSEWRKKNVNSFVSGMYCAVKNIDKDVIVSISPSGNIDYNYEVLYADVRLWSGEDGYCDWIIPQVYFGFENETNPFEQSIGEWYNIKTNDRVKIIAGLALYKAGEKDEFAGNGIDEWTENDDIIKREIEFCKNLGYDGVSLYSYGYMKDTNLEWQNTKELLNNF